MTYKERDFILSTIEAYESATASNNDRAGELIIELLKAYILEKEATDNTKDSKQ